MSQLRQAAQQALEALELHAKQYPHMQKGYTVDAITALRTALRTALEQQAEPMTEVADRFAHRMALELECVLADRNVNWDRAMNLIGEYRSAMNAIHEQHSPTFMGEPRI